MDSFRPQYFYLTHMHVSHPLVLQKVISLAKLFTDKDPSCTISHTEIVKGFFSLIIQSTQIVDPKVSKVFESNVAKIEGVGLIFAQKTTDVSRVGHPHPPTFVCSWFFKLNFGFLSYYFGEGLLFRLKLKKMLDKLKGDAYDLDPYPTEMAVIIESVTPFDPQEVELLLNFLKNKHLQLVVTFCNF